MHYLVAGSVLVAGSGGGFESPPGRIRPGSKYLSKGALR